MTEAQRVARHTQTFSANCYSPQFTYILSLMMSSEKPNYVNCAHATAPQDGNFANRKRLVICCDGTWNNSYGTSPMEYSICARKRDILTVLFSQKPGRRLGAYQRQSSLCRSCTQVLHRHGPGCLLPPRPRYRRVVGCQLHGRLIRSGSKAGMRPPQELDPAGPPEAKDMFQPRTS